MKKYRVKIEVFVEFDAPDDYEAEDVGGMVADDLDDMLSDYEVIPVRRHDARAVGIMEAA